MVLQDNFNNLAEGTSGINIAGSAPGSTPTSEQSAHLENICYQTDVSIDLGLNPRPTSVPGTPAPSGPETSAPGGPGSSAPSDSGTPAPSDQGTSAPTLITTLPPSTLFPATSAPSTRVPTITSSSTIPSIVPSLTLVPPTATPSDAATLQPSSAPSYTNKPTVILEKLEVISLFALSNNQGFDADYLNNGGPIERQVIDASYNRVAKDVIYQLYADSGGSVRIADSSQNPLLRQLKRRQLQVTFQSGQTSQYTDIKCPPSVLDGAMCQNVTASFTLLLSQDENSTTVKNTSTYAVDEAIQYGTLQKILTNYSSPFMVVNDSVVVDQPSASPTMSGTTPGPSQKPTPGPSQKPTQAGLFTGETTIQSSWITSNTVGLTASDLSPENSVRKFLEEAYSRTVLLVIRNINSSSGRRLRRRLSVDFVGNSSVLSKIMDTRCPESAPVNTVCQAVFASYTLQLVEESQDLIQATYTNATQSAINNGVLQNQLDTVDPKNPLNIEENAIVISIPPSTAPSLASSPTQAPEPDPKGSFFDKPTIIGVVVGSAVTVFGVLFIWKLSRGKKQPKTGDDNLSDDGRLSVEPYPSPRQNSGDNDDDDDDSDYGKRKGKAYDGDKESAINAYGQLDDDSEDKGPRGTTRKEATKGFNDDASQESEDYDDFNPRKNSAPAATPAARFLGPLVGIKSFGHKDDSDSDSSDGGPGPKTALSRDMSTKTDFENYQFDDPTVVAVQKRAGMYSQSSSDSDSDEESDSGWEDEEEKSAESSTSDEYLDDSHDRLEASGSENSVHKIPVTNDNKSKTAPTTDKGDDEDSNSESESESDEDTNEDSASKSEAETESYDESESEVDVTASEAESGSGSEESEDESEGESKEQSMRVSESGSESEEESDSGSESGEVSDSGSESEEESDSGSESEEKSDSGSESEEGMDSGSETEGSGKLSASFTTESDAETPVVMGNRAAAPPVERPQGFADFPEGGKDTSQRGEIAAGAAAGGLAGGAGAVALTRGYKEKTDPGTDNDDDGSASYTDSDDNTYEEGTYEENLEDSVEVVSVASVANEAIELARQASERLERMDEDNSLAKIEVAGLLDQGEDTSEARSKDMDDLVKKGDWDGIINSATQMEKKLDDSGTGPESDDGSGMEESGGSGSGTSYSESEESSLVSDDSSHSTETGDESTNLGESTDISEMPSEIRRKEEIRAEVVALVRLVVPEEVDNIDTMLTQFRGREEELLQTLRTMQERSVSVRARAAVHKSKGRPPPRREQGPGYRRDGAYSIDSRQTGDSETSRGSAAGSAAIAAASIPRPATGRVPIHPPPVPTHELTEASEESSPESQSKRPRGRNLQSTSVGSEGNLGSPEGSTSASRSASKSESESGSGSASESRSTSESGSGSEDETSDGSSGSASRSDSASGSESGSTSASGSGSDSSSSGTGSASASESNENNPPPRMSSKLGGSAVPGGVRRGSVVGKDTAKPWGYHSDSEDDGTTPGLSVGHYR